MKNRQFLNLNFLLRSVIPMLMGGGILTFLIVKSVMMQITHDESYTVEILTKESIWHIIAYTSSYTNNHILNTLLVKGLFSLFNSTDYALARVPNIAAFMVYFYYCFQFSRRFIADKWVCLMFMSVMCGNPYLLDFFALIRGYGLSIGLMMGSIYYAARFIVQQDARSLPLSMGFAILSVYAQFASLHFYLGLNLFVCIFLTKTYLTNRHVKPLIKHSGILILSFLILLAMIYLPIKAIITDNQIAYYGKDGFWENTMTSLISASLYGQGYFSDGTFTVFNSLSIGLFFMLTAYIAHGLGAKTLGQEEKMYPSVFAAFLFGSTALSTVLQFNLLGNQYVVDRTALFFYPLFALLMPVVPLFMAHFKKGVGIFVCILFSVFSVNHVIRSASTKYYWEWQYDVHTFEVLNLMKAAYDKTDKKQPLRLTTNWLFCPSFSYHRTQAHSDYLAPIIYHSPIDTVNVYDFYYTVRNEVSLLQSKYDVVKDWDKGQSVLLQRKK